MATIRTIAAYLAFTFGIGLALVAVLSLPPEDTPWGELSLDHPTGAFTEMKLTGLRGEGNICRDLLAESAVEFTPLPDEEFDQNCAFRNVVNLERSVTPYSAPVRITCPAAASLYLWERDVVQPAARLYFGQEVSQIRHYGTYSCRNVYGRSSGRVSEHASANAIDIAGFTLSGGRAISVQNDWEGESPEARFLRDVRDGACRTFRAVLGPDYNAAHADHFHLDMGRFDICS